MDIEYTESDFREHANKKSMWIGSNAMTSTVISLIDHKNNYINEKIDTSDKAYKIFDELITNAFDHRIKCGDAPKEHGGPVVNIDVSYKDNILTVTNDGPGFRIHRMEKSGLWSVESVCTKPFSGSNNKEDPFRIVGGQNGLGLKLIILSTIRTTVSTTSLGDGYSYRQVYTADGDDLKISEPEVVQIAKTTDTATTSTINSKNYLKTGTSISMELNYAKMFSGWADMNTETQNRIKRAFALSIIARLNQLIIFSQEIGYATKNKEGDVVFFSALPPVKCTYNGTPLRVTAEALLRASNPQITGDIFTFRFEDPLTIKFPWTIMVAVAKPQTRNRVPGLSMVNNVTMMKSGTHTTWFQNHLEEQIIGNMGKAIRDKVAANGIKIKKYMAYMDFKFIPIANFRGQTKDSVTIDQAVWNKEKLLYSLVPEEGKEIAGSPGKVVANAAKYKAYREIIRNIAKAIETLILFDLKNKPKLDLAQRNSFSNDLHTPAVCMGVENNAVLAVSEGDTAEGTVIKIIRNAGKELSRRVGFFSLRGVIINAIKNSKTEKAGDEEFIIYSNQFEKNAVITKLIGSINLDRNCDYFTYPKNDTYKPTAEEVERAKKGDADFNKLNYRRLLICTDQDQDGSQITGLVIALINHQWPYLFKRGFVLKYISPLLRVIDTKTKKITRFYSDADFQKFLADNYAGTTPKHLRVNRYKGLGTHSEEDIKRDMAPKTRDDSFGFIMDKIAVKYITDIYGKTTVNRKLLLKSDGLAEFNPDLYKSKRILTSEYMIKDVAAFHRYNISRKLKSYLDGLNITQRKIIALCRTDRKATKKININSLVGLITARMGYPHGDASGIQTVAYSAQKFAGANNCPILYSYSAGVGSIEKGRDDIGQARYLNVGYNGELCDLLFPPDDDPLLQWHNDEKQQLEPHTYVSIIPYSILESATTPSSGWKINFWGRDIGPVFKNLIQMIQADTVTSDDFINNTPQLQEYPKIEMEDLIGRIWMPTYQPKNKPTQTWRLNKTGKVTEYSIGRYKVSGDKIKITSIPYRYWLGNLDESIKAKGADKKLKHILARNERVLQVVNHSIDENNLQLSIQLTEGTVDWINTDETITPHSNEKIDKITKVLELYNEITLELNFTDENGNITCFNTFTEIERKWYVCRRNLYLERIARGTEIMQAKLCMLLNKLRYIRSSDGKVFYPAYSRTSDIQDTLKYLDTLNLSPDELVTTLRSANNTESKLDPFTIGNRTSKTDRHTILEQQRFSRIDSTLLGNVGQTKWSDIYTKIVDSSEAKYRYIDDIRVTDFDTDSVTNLVQEIKNQITKISDLNTNSWKTIWLREIEKIKLVIKAGLQSNWTVENLSDYTYE